MWLLEKRLPITLAKALKPKILDNLYQFRQPGKFKLLF